MRKKEDMELFRKVTVKEGAHDEKVLLHDYTIHAYNYLQNAMLLPVSHAA